MASTRARFRRFGAKKSERLSHLYVIGKTGVGKSSLLELLDLQDIAAGRGFVLIDPHRELAERVRIATDVRKDGGTSWTGPPPVNPARFLRAARSLRARLRRGV
jgi:ABC-type phosphate/phosphonate transport system ATPase subunit